MSSSHDSKTAIKQCSSQSSLLYYCNNCHNYQLQKLGRTHSAFRRGVSSLEDAPAKFHPPNCEVDSHCPICGYQYRVDSCGYRDA